VTCTQIGGLPLNNSKVLDFYFAQSEQDVVFEGGVCRVKVDKQIFQGLHARQDVA